MSKYIKVESSKLSDLMDHVSALITVKSSLNQIVSSENNADMKKVAEEIELVSDYLQDTAIQLNRVSFSNLVSLLQDHLVKLAPDQVTMTLVMNGDDALLEKKTTDELFNPLSLLVEDICKNWISNDKATSGDVLIEQSTTTDTIRVVITDSLIQNGDYVLSNMEEIQSSINEKGGEFVQKQNVQGKHEFIFTIPASLSIVEGLLVVVNQVNLVIPLASIVKCVAISATDIKNNRGKTLVIDEEQIPYIHMRDQFDLGEDDPESFYLIITRCGDREIGFTADTIIGEYKGAHKNLGHYFEDVTHFSGGTILGNGSVAMLLNPMSFV